MQKKLRPSLEAAEQAEQLAQASKMEAVGRLASGIIHDFNNLLTVIKGNLGLLREQMGEKTDPNQVLLIDDALSATRQGVELTAGLLAFCRRQPLHPQRTRMNRVMENLERVLDRVLGPTITWRTEIDPLIPDLLADPAQLQSALLNLALNARDAMPDGGTLNLRITTLDVQSESPITELAPGQYVAIEVTDTGIGMDADTLTRACEPFFTTKAFGKGTGLGLSTIHNFVTQLQGGLSLESQPGQGATVRLFLPALEPFNERTARGAIFASPLSSPVANGCAETILVVEDQAPIRRLACHYLSDLGYQVLEAADAEEALVILETEPEIHSVFSDIIMPGEQNGYDLARWLAIHRPCIKCLLTTGHDEGMGVDFPGHSAPPLVLAKPYTREQLVHGLRQALDE